MPNKKPLILVFGVSGVGKSTLCSILSSADDRFLHLEAGALLREAHGVNAEQLRLSSTAQVQDNQMALIDQLAAKRNEHEQKIVLLCAHSVIDNDDELVIVPIDVVAALEPSCMISIQSDPMQIIRNRENSKPSRYRPTRSSAEIDEQQTLSNLTTQSYADQIGIPLATLSNPTPKSFSSKIYEMIESIGNHQL